MDRSADPRHYAFIDALRGYAILLVMIVHGGRALPGTPYPLIRLYNMGWNGVQLFFLASGLTLCLSWSARRDERRRTARFFARRIARIAPMYWLTLAGVTAFDRPAGPLEWSQVMAFATFSNGWSPHRIGAVPGEWIPVPGGWSIAVEFGFYALFPLLAVALTTLRRALLALAGFVALAVVANAWAATALEGGYAPEVVTLFLYYWLPNQMPVFAGGIVLFHLARAGTGGTFLRAWGVPLGVVAVVAVSLIQTQVYVKLPSVWPVAIPTHWLAAGAFGMLIMGLSARPGSWLVNRWSVALGRVSFSAYLLHFFVIDALLRWAGALFNPASTGVWAAALSGLCIVATTVATYPLAALTYRWVERPMARAVNAWLTELGPAPDAAVRVGAD